MSMLNRPATGTDVGETVSSVRDYETAQKTVSKLIAGEVPARDIAIVGLGVSTVERVTGKLGYAVAARSGAINGVLIGLILSAIMLFGDPDAPIQLFLGFVFIGVALGMVMSLISYSIVRRRRDFASVTQVAADRYEVRVQHASLSKARQVIGAAAKPATVRPEPDLSEPPRFGERIDPNGGQDAAATRPVVGEQTSTPDQPIPSTSPPVPPVPPMPAPEPAAPPLPPVPAHPEDAPEASGDAASDATGRSEPAPAADEEDDASGKPGPEGNS